MIMNFQQPCTFFFFPFFHILMSSKISLCHWSPKINLLRYSQHPFGYKAQSTGEKRFNAVRSSMCSAVPWVWDLKALSSCTILLKTKLYCAILQNSAR